MKLVDVTSDFYSEYNEDSNVTKPKFKVGDHVKIKKYKNTKTFSLKDTLKIVQKKFLFLVKLKAQFRGSMLLVI